MDDCVLLVVQGFDVGALRQEVLHDGPVAGDGGQVQGRVAILVPRLQ